MEKFNKGDVVKFVGGSDEWTVTGYSESDELIIQLNENVRTALSNYSDKVVFVRHTKTKKLMKLKPALFVSSLYYSDSDVVSAISTSNVLFASEDDARRYFGEKFIRMMDEMTVEVWMEE
jgi:hypothetical protein